MLHLHIMEIKTETPPIHIKKKVGPKYKYKFDDLQVNENNCLIIGPYTKDKYNTLRQCIYIYLKREVNKGKLIRLEVVTEGTEKILKAYRTA